MTTIPPPTRECLTEIREGITRRFSIPTVREDGTKETLKLYIIANTDQEGRLREVFIKADKMGGLPSGALDAVAMTISIGLQYGIPLDVFTTKLRHIHCSPFGFTGDPEFPNCSSPFDLLAQFLDRRFGKGKDDPAEGIVK